MARLPYDCEMGKGATLTMEVDLGGGYFPAWIITVKDIHSDYVELCVESPQIAVNRAGADSESGLRAPAWDMP